MDTIEMCCNMRPFLKIIKLIISIVQFSVPLLLIILGTIDMLKAVASADEKVVSEVRKSFFKRLLYGFLIFIVPYMLSLILSFAEAYIIKDDSGLTSSTSWVSCWNNIDNDSYCDGQEDIYAPDKVCYVYNKNGIGLSSTRKPTESDDGLVTVYTCNNNISCFQYYSVTKNCKFSKSMSIDKITTGGTGEKVDSDNSAPTPEPTTYNCYQFEYCSSGYYCDGKCYGTNTSAKTYSGCRQSSGKTCFNENAGLCASDGGINNIFETHLKYFTNGSIPDVKKYSDGKLVTCTVPCDQASASTCS